MTPTSEIITPNANAFSAVSRPDGIGRLAVRRIRASVWRSTTWLRAEAPLAIRAVPNKACQKTGQASGRAATSRKPAAVVKTTIKLIRGLVSSTKSAHWEPRSIVVASAVNGVSVWKMKMECRGQAATSRRGASVYRFTRPASTGSR